MLVHVNSCNVGNCEIVEGDHMYPWAIGRYIWNSYGKTSSFKLCLLYEDQDTEAGADLEQNLGGGQCTNWGVWLRRNTVARGRVGRTRQCLNT